MIHYTGFYFCTRSNWDGEMFDVCNLVSIERKTEDFNNILDKKSLFPDDEYNKWRSYYELKPEVFKWLEDNIKDQNKELKGWCCGNKDYNSNVSEGFSLFFYRRKDALNFIKIWSIYKKPTETYNQNTYVHKILNKSTNTLKIVNKNNYENN